MINFKQLVFKKKESFFLKNDVFDFDFIRGIAE